jgi:hypothetical protein
LSTIVTDGVKVTLAVPVNFLYVSSEGERLMLLSSASRATISTPEGGCLHYYIDATIDVPASKSKSRRLEDAGYYELLVPLPREPRLKMIQAVEQCILGSVNGSGENRYGVWQSGEGIFRHTDAEGEDPLAALPYTIPILATTIDCVQNTLLYGLYHLQPKLSGKRNRELVVSCVLQTCRTWT